MIAAIGELVLDVTIAPEGRLNPDDDRDAAISLRGGGQAANFCAWAASLGESARLVTRIGDDDAGSRLLAELEAGGVHVQAVRGQGPTGAVAVIIGPAGERTLARQKGAASGLRAEDLEEAWFEDVGLLHVPAYSLFWEPLAGAARKALDLVRRGGGLVSLDLSSAADLRAYGGARMASDLARLRPELLFATEAEAAELGTPLVNLAKVPVTKLGAGGCRVFERRVPAAVVAVVDGNGAGDAFAAAFCAAYLEGATPLEAAGRAVLVGARAVSQAGARP
ncbi:MAG: carbohydrate kinase family protein [Candidatus Dormibacteraeota bacterium]|nr:carbohydrate kinase family protein [Candidatus Dormibacteraeota bacterium]